MGRLPDVAPILLPPGGGKHLQDFVHLHLEQFYSRGFLAFQFAEQDLPPTSMLKPASFRVGLNNTRARIHGSLTERSISVNTVYRILPYLYGADMSLPASSPSDKQNENEQRKVAAAIRRSQLFQHQLVESGVVGEEEECPALEIPEEVEPKSLESYFQEQAEAFSRFCPPDWSRDESRQVQFLQYMMEKFEELEPGDTISLHYLIFDCVVKMKPIMERLGLDVNNVSTDLLKACFPNLPGITTSFLYASLHASVFSLHLEDTAADSLSLILSKEGYKIWVIVPAYHAENVILSLREYIKQHRYGKFFASACYNRFQHKDLFLHTRLFEIWGIDYSIFVQPPGSIVILSSCSFHEGIAYNPSIAVSVNLALYDFTLHFKQIPLRYGCLCENGYGWTPSKEEIQHIWTTHLRRERQVEKLKFILADWEDYALRTFEPTGDKIIWKVEAYRLVSAMKLAKAKEVKLLRAAVRNLHLEDRLSLLDEKLRSVHYPIRAAAVKVAVEGLGQIPGSRLYQLFMSNQNVRGIYKLFRLVLQTSQPTIEQVRLFLCSCLQLFKFDEMLEVWKDFGQDGPFFEFVSNYRDQFPAAYLRMCLVQELYHEIVSFVSLNGPVFGALKDASDLDIRILCKEMEREKLSRESAFKLFGFPWEAFSLDCKWNKQGTYTGRSFLSDIPSSPGNHEHGHGPLVSVGGVSKFSCSCGKLYRQKGHLVRHIGSATGSLVYQCPVCAKSMTRKETYLEHLRNIHQGAIHICPSCNNEYKSAGNLNRHILRSHKQ